MPLADEIQNAINRAVAEALSKVELRAGTIVLSPSYQVGDPLTVVLDGSAVAVEVKMIRAFNVFPNARVVCARVGVDWTAIGVFLDPSQGNIVAGVPGGGRIEFDPDAVTARVYDSQGRMVIELDAQLGVWVTDPDGAPDNRVRIRTEIGQLVLSQSPGSDDDFFPGRVVTGTANIGLANEYVFTQMEGVGVKPGTDFNYVSLRGERADNSVGPVIEIASIGDDTPGLINLRTDGQLAFDPATATAVFTVDGDIIAGSCNGINANALSSGTDTTTSASYVNMAGTGSTTSFSFTKRWAATRIKVIMNVSAYATSAAADGMMGVSINGTDYDMMEEAFLLNNRLPYSSVRYISGVAAGTHTIQARWRRTSASGTLTRDPSCWISMSAEETN